MASITVTNAGHNLLRDALRGSNTSTIKYVAFGTSNTTPTTADVALGNEIYRKAVSTYTVGTTGEVLVSMYLSPTEGVGDSIQEVGFFSGSSASSTANTGVLLARGLYVHASKLATESIIFTLDITL